ncbi:MAG TPA: diacylglycerol kinase family protein [Acidimicrobiia bacterium]|nr:diacylglycerol kinase family protein [Acidimicrobiia bacterium]
MRVALLVNATASKVTATDRDAVRAVLAREHTVELLPTQRPQHATTLAREAADRGFDIVAVLAGDGTLNEAANGLAGTDAALAPLPGGSTNVYARTLGVSLTPTVAAERLLGSLRRGSRLRIGLGVANDRHFLFHCGIGFDAAVIKRVERRRPLKRYFAHPLYVAAALDTWFRHYDRRRQRFDVRLPTGETVTDAGFAIVSKTSPYTYLGRRGLVVAPEAGLDTPLSVNAFQAMDPVTLLAGAGSAMLGGHYLARRPGVVHRSGLTQLEITATRPFPWQVDGDYVAIATRLELGYAPDVLELVLP